MQIQRDKAETQLEDCRNEREQENAEILVKNTLLEELQQQIENLQYQLQNNDKTSSQVIKEEEEIKEY